VGEEAQVLRGLQPAVLLPPLHAVGEDVLRVAVEESVDVEETVAPHAPVLQPASTTCSEHAHGPDPHVSVNTTYALHTHTHHTRTNQPHTTQTHCTHTQTRPRTHTPHKNTPNKLERGFVLHGGGEDNVVESAQALRGAGVTEGTLRLDPHHHLRGSAEADVA
jgi:hypothetical protein